jgi:hypothetical protein
MPPADQPRWHAHANAGDGPRQRRCGHRVVIRATRAGVRQAQLVDQLPDQPQLTPARARQGSGAGCGAGPAADCRLDPATRHPTATLTGWMLQDPYKDGVGAASLTARTKSSNSLARDGGRQLLHAASGRHADAQQGRSARRQPRRPATAPCRRRGRYALLGGPAGPGSTGPSPCGPESGVAPAQRRPAATPASRQRHGPLLLGRCGACPSP